MFMKNEEIHVRKKVLFLLAIGFLFGNIIASLFYEDLQNIVLQMENEIEETVGTIDGNYFMYLVDVVEERMKALLFFLAIFSVPWGRKIYIFRFFRKGICFGVLFGVFVRLYSLWGIGIFMMFTFPHELLYLLSEINGIKLLEGFDRKYQNRLWYLCGFLLRVVGITLLGVMSESFFTSWILKNHLF